MSADASAAFSPDIQRALQQAVGDANDAANAAKKKKSKRARDADGTPSGESTDTSAKRKKSKQRHDAFAGEIASGSDVPMNLADSTSLEQGASKKKRKDKEKEQEQGSQAEGTRPSQPVDSPAGDPTSSADFISAVVAAASATSGQHVHPEHGVHLDQSVSSFLPFAGEFAPYPYAPQPHPDQFAPPQNPMFPDLSGLVPDLNLQSSEDLLRTLQEFDLSRVMNVLRTLGEAATAANVSVTGQPPYMPHIPPGPPPVNQQPVRSDVIVGRPPRQKETEQSGAEPAPSNLPPPPPLPEPDNPEHAHMLANVWMNATKLAELVKSEGLVYKKGKFSAIEEAQLNTAVENYRVSRGLSQEQLNEIIFSRERGRDTFWSEITSSLHLRPIIAVYHHVRRTRHPMGQQGKWMPTEDDLLIQAVADLGQQWEKVSQRVGRMSSDCRDRWRNHLQDRGNRRSGAWTKEEEEELTRIVTEQIAQRGGDIDNDIFWGVVSQRMGGKRGRQQCRIKWTDSISTQIKNQGERPRWGQTDAYILVHKVDSLNVRDDSEIDWKLLPDEHWNLWSAHSLQRRWLTMKRGIKGHEEMTHTEIMEILKTKKAHALPMPTASKKKKSKVTSAADVVDADEMEESPVAGSSSQTM